VGPGGLRPPGGGLWGVSPHKTLKRGELPTLVTPLRVGPETLANPKPTRVGKGVEGAQAPSQGVWGMCPQNKKRGGELPTFANLPTSGALNAGKPSAYGGGQRGDPGGRSPHGGGSWGVSPHKTLKGSELPTLASQPRVGPKKLANPQPTGVGKGGI
jgi:hypothetical protein